MQEVRLRASGLVLLTLAVCPSTLVNARRAQVAVR